MTLSPGELGPWGFEWTDPALPPALAQVTGQLRWRGLEFGFALDGLLGMDGRLTPLGLATMEPHLQRLVLQHVVADCLQSLAGSRLADVSLTAIEWQEESLPMQGEFDFVLRRPGAQGSSRGCLTAFGDAARLSLMNALAAQQWPVPAPFAQVNGTLQMGTVCLAADELAGLEVGDWVWLLDAELSPSGLRAQLAPSDGQAGCTVWLKRSVMTRDTLPCAAVHSQSDPALISLTVRSPSLSVDRTWLLGAQGAQRLAQSALAMPWCAWRDGQACFEGQLAIVGRRLGLRVTRLFPSVLQPRTQVI